MPVRIQIILPGLFDLPLAEFDPGLPGRLTSLNRILRFANPVLNQLYSVDAILRSALDLETGVTETRSGQPQAPPGLPIGPPGLPIAQAFAEQKYRDSGQLLLSQAIHLQAGLHSAVIVPIQDNERNNLDISFIINDLRDYFNVDCDISEITAGLFLVRLLGFQAPVHYPHLLSVLGKTANPYIEQARQILPWYRLLNEIQMFMHQHEINQRRLQDGLLPVNSLWFWGAGIPPPAGSLKLAWYCDDPLLNRFAQSLGLSLRASEAIVLDDDFEAGLVVDLRILELLKTSAADDPEKLLLDIDQHLLRPVLKRAEQQHGSLRLRAGYEFDFELQPRAGWKFWRRAMNLASWKGYSAEP